MRWAKSEYLLKGVFLGLLLYVALQELDWAATGRIALWLFGGLFVGLTIGAFRQFKDLKGLGKNPIGFLIFLLLENPGAIYFGVVFALAGGAVTENKFSETNPDKDKLIGYCVLGGALFGYGLGELREMTRGYYRLGLTFLLCVGAFVGVYFWLDAGNFLENQQTKTMLGVHLLLGIPFFYLLVFCGMAEESEVEIGALCSTLGLGLWLVQFPRSMPSLGFLLPVSLFCIYSIRVLAPLRVFKHTLRGFGHYEVGRIRNALFSFNRALQLDPKNTLAKTGLVRLHRKVNVDLLDTDTRGMLNPNLCIGEASNMLLSGTPSPEKRKEATSLLTFVAAQWPQMTANTDYYRVIADTHGQNYDAAADRLNALLDPTAWKPDDRFRQAILFDAWQLALRTHPELKRRSGDPQLELPGRRMEALLAIERQIRQTSPPDEALLDFRRELFEPLTESQYLAVSAKGYLEDFCYDYAQERGLALLASPTLWLRGAEILRMVVSGNPERGPVVFQNVADTADVNGQPAEALKYRQMAREAGRTAGIDQLPPDQKTAFFQIVKKLADDAKSASQWKEAIFNYTLYTQFEGSGKETKRTLADLYENDGQVMLALKSVEDALTGGADADLNARKDKYYYSVEPDELKVKSDEVRSYFDVKYCVKKARTILDSNSPELDNLDWATHLAKLSLVMEPKNLIANVQMARCHLRRGERDDGLRCLEDVRELKYSGNDERDAWEWTLRQLGALYLDEYNRPDLAIDCLKLFLDSDRSGARTLYDLGRAHEAKGESDRAINYYRQAAAFEDNPVRWDAEEAIRRLKEKATSGA